MTRNRAILADIAEFGLDPAKPHTNTHANGRLSKHASTSNEPVVEQAEVVEVKNALVELEEQKTEEAPAESQVHDETPMISEEKVEHAPKKKGKKNPTE